MSPEKSSASYRRVSLRDFQPPEYLIDSVDLHFDLEPHATRVRSRLRMRRNGRDAAQGAPLRLAGEKLRLVSIALDGVPLTPSRHSVDERELCISGLPTDFTLEIETLIDPAANTEIAGLFRPNAVYCTHCEPEHFRRITYYLDRPDVLAPFTVTITADKAACPVLLSNGNCIATGELDGGRHWARWNDPFAKPAYLFALVAGDLAHAQSTFITRAGRAVTLRIFVEPGRADRCEFALHCLKQAMAWEEKEYGLEYDLEAYHIAALDDFPSGAMENKGLNVFSSRAILVDAATATDMDLLTCQSIIAHEYFHNWTGNRVTCRDWFQLSVKEGLTVFRTQQFSMAHQHCAVRLIRDVRMMLDEFRQAAGPLSHSVQPKSYVEINNFYTYTVYDKGAQVIRMLRTMIGEDAYRRGMTLYIQRFDGAGATIEDFLSSMADAAAMNLDCFSRWYHQPGTPIVSIRTEYAADRGEVLLTCQQRWREENRANQPVVIPLQVGFLDQQGKPLSLRRVAADSSDARETHLVFLKEDINSFRFSGAPAKPVLSAFRAFSAPVIAELGHSDEELAVLAVHDTDGFDRWWWSAQLTVRELLRLAKNAPGAGADLSDAFRQSFQAALALAETDPMLAAQLLSLPSAYEIADGTPQIDVALIESAIPTGARIIAQHFRAQFERMYADNLRTDATSADPKAVGGRLLKNLSLFYLLRVDEPRWGEVSLTQLRTGPTLTESLGAFTNLIGRASAQRETAIEYAFARWGGDKITRNKLYETIGEATPEDALAQIVRQRDAGAFGYRDSGAVRALLLSFADRNLLALHVKDGSGYEALHEAIRRIDPINPYLAARLLGKIVLWRRFDLERQAAITAMLGSLLSVGVSRNVFEIVSRALAPHATDGAAVEGQSRIGD